jgi:hypothetical protein
MQFSAARTALMTILLVTVLQASIQAQEPIGKPPASLLIYPKSENVRYNQQQGAWWAYYDVKVQYPADDVLRFIRGKLEGLGWSPLKEDIFNPGEPSSHITGWRDFVDGRTTPKTKVHQWLAQWKDPQGNVVWYVLKYRHPVGKSSIPNTMSVVATYYPASIVQQQLKWVQDEKNKKK